ncbi:MAG: NAD-dependent epimerase/dehydratase family protein [Sphingomonadales bacterium]|nr:NAD-dependent epimerase/dehydratase family protein [Sphingomonadales bacterium]
MSSLLLIGATSALGRWLCDELARHHAIRTVGRRGDVDVCVDAYDAIPEAAFGGIDVVINCVGTHSGTADEMAYVNATIPAFLAKASRVAGVSQLIHFSSLKAYGYATYIDADTVPVPTLEYGHSKLNGEAAVLDAAGDGLTVSIIRPPAVYGHGSGANIAKLIKFMARFGFFIMPWGDVKRSVANIENIAPVIEKLIAEKRSGVTLIADEGEMSLKGLAKMVSDETGKGVRVLSLPSLFLFPLRLLARPLYNSLFESQIVVPTYQRLGAPLDEGLRTFVKDVLKN